MTQKQLLSFEAVRKNPSGLERRHAWGTAQEFAGWGVCAVRRVSAGLRMTPPDGTPDGTPDRHSLADSPAVVARPAALQPAQALPAQLYGVPMQPPPAVGITAHSATDGHGSTPAHSGSTIGGCPLHHTPCATRRRCVAHLARLVNASTPAQAAHMTAAGRDGDL